MTPPMIAASMGSSVRPKPKRAKKSTSTELRPIPASDPTMKSRPKCRQAMRKSGTLSRMVITPTGRPVSWLMIMAVPTTPPEVMLLG